MFYMNKPPFQPAQSLAEFFEAFGINTLASSPDPDKVIRLCESLIKEEAREVAYAFDGFYTAQIFNDDESRPTLIHLAKELADLIYVCFYTAHALGIPLEQIFRDVHGSNMSKLENGQVVRREDGKVLKGKDYREPDLERYF